MTAAAEEVTTDGLMSFLEKHLVDGKPGSPTREQLDDWVYDYAMPNEAAPVPASDATTGPVDAAHLAGTERFLLSTGRLDLLEPRYLELAASGSGLDAARRIFALSRAALDPFVARRLEQIVRP